MHLFVCIYTDLQQLLLSALGAQYVLCVGDEPLAHERGAALRADEAVVVPVAVLEGDEAGTTYAWKYKQDSFSIIIK